MSLSDLFSRFLEFIGSEVSPAEHPTDGQPGPAAKAQTAQPTGKYAPIREAVESKLEHLLRHEIPTHREIAGDDYLELHCLEIEAAPEGQALLDEFCQEFKPAARQAWVRTFIGNNPAVKLDSFAGVFRQAELPSIEHLDPLLQILNLGAPATYRVSLWTRWVQAAPRPQAPSHSAPGARGNPVVLRIQDGQGIRAEIRRETYPIKIGRLGDIAVDGTFTSGEHCSLHWNGGQVELEDHSKNGTWLDGAKLHRQSQPLGLGKHRLKLGKDKGEAKDWPEIEVEILAETVTPIAPVTPVNTGNATPIASDAGTLLAVLSVQDATGNPHLDLSRLPFSIGRGTGRDYVTPPAHAGVSGLHLIIEALGERGAEVLNEAHAKNGTALEGVLQGERFLWPFDQTITLAPQWKNAPPVRIVLKRPG